MEGPMLFTRLINFLKDKLFEEVPETGQPDTRDGLRSINENNERAHRERNNVDEPSAEQLQKMQDQKARRKKIILISLAVVLLSALAGTAASVYFKYHISNSDIEDCKFYFKTEDYSNAFKKCSKTRKIKDPEILFALGSMYHYQKGLPQKKGKKQDERQRMTEALNLYREAAKMDYIPALQILGKLYLNGSRGVIVIDEDHAADWFTRGALQGDYVSMRELSDILLRKKQFEEAVPWLERLAEYGDSDAALSLAELYFNGTEIPADPVKAFHWCEQSARSANREAEHLLSLMYITGSGTAPDAASAFRNELRAARGGLEKAMYQVGFFYEKGIGTPVDLQQAVSWYEEAAGKRYPSALYRLGMMYLRGEYVDRDEQKAVSLLRDAADLKDPDALLRLGRMYQNGETVDRDYGEAIRLLEKAARFNLDDAYYYLGIAYSKGLGTIQDQQAAVAWFTRAAEHNHTLSQYSLGLIHYELEQYRQAYEWFSRAMENGHAYSAAYLGMMSANGLGCEVSYYMAYYYFLVSEYLYDDSTTRENLAMIRSSLSRAQQGAAESRADKFINHLRSQKKQR